MISPVDTSLLVWEPMKQGHLPSPQGGLRYCLLKYKLRISNFLTWVLKYNLIFKVESFWPFTVLWLGLHAKLVCPVCKITSSDLKEERQHFEHVKVNLTHDYK